jgi:hypothetical protein
VGQAFQPVSRAVAAFAMSLQAGFDRTNPRESSPLHVADESRGNRCGDLELSRNVDERMNRPEGM